MKKGNGLLVGITIDKFKGISPAALLMIIRKMGVEFAEITKAVFEDLPAFLEQMDGLQTGFHLPNRHDAGYDFSCHDRAADIEKLTRLINQHHRELNIFYCLSHPPEFSSAKMSEADAISYLLDNLKKLQPPIVLENIQSWSQQKFEHFFQQARNVLGEQLIGQCFDAPHYFLQGEDPVAFLQENNGQIQFIHLSDCRQGYDAHMPFGPSGEMPIDEILLTLKAQNFQGVINLELLPRKIGDIRLLVNSYLKVVRAFDRQKYWKARLRLIVYTPMLLRFMKQVL
ncbi:MAG: sugar phosphate isomerase/epimerase [candidate division KSB1 bacterium]|nr:sugar phosphate isomerase/epimerase [candidate division KSB1 bacterium]MDZ7340421.1 sugar phosphate isomerase/epimerase [candidate division KSB1 bacterium]